MSYDPNPYYNPNSYIFNEKADRQVEVQDIEIDPTTLNIVEKNWVTGRRQDMALSITGYLRTLGFGTNV